MSNVFLFFKPLSSSTFTRDLTFGSHTDLLENDYGTVIGFKCHKLMSLPRNFSNLYTELGI